MKFPFRRQLTDRAMAVTVSAGGIGVLLAIVAIFFYLLYQVLPLFRGAGISSSTDIAYPLPGDVRPLYLAVEEQGEAALAIKSGGQGAFFSLESGQTLLEIDLGLPDSQLTAVRDAGAASQILGLAYSNGQVRVLEHELQVSFVDERRVLTPAVRAPFGERSFSLADGVINQFSLRESERMITMAATDEQGRLTVIRLIKERDFLSGETTLIESRLALPNPSRDVVRLHMGSDQRWLYQIHADGSFLVWNLADHALTAPYPEHEGRLFEDNSGLAASAMLLGDVSLLAASTSGELSQYFMAPATESMALVKVRSFDTQGVSIDRILPEPRRKGFIGLGKRGELQIYHTTAHRRLLSKTIGNDNIIAAALSPRADQLLTLSESGTLGVYNITNEHPEVSWSALWSKIWYESYTEPAYIWQSSASTNDFEPKYSFSPLAFGTLKAAFYAMLVAAPLAVLGAVYTAYFMAPGLRRKVKPMIELMEAMPTVILGFLAGLWLAPWIEANLAQLLSAVLLIPIGIVAFTATWNQLPDFIRQKVPPGWQAGLLIPVIIALVYCCPAVGHLLETSLFSGDMRQWLSNELGVAYDQRNALVVGIAMGMAVIPTIFSIAEDAIYSVPQHLSDGSLALGATPWQTMSQTILPTASPGIFSALMIGMGRAVGETMIVLMATGNTPIMDINLFEGMRTLAANIAVEVPEAEVNSTHYRVLFLAALVLFIFTFLINTVAEVIRQRLRHKYSSL